MNLCFNTVSIPRLLLTPKLLLTPGFQTEILMKSSPMMVFTLSWELDALAIALDPYAESS